MRFVKIFLCLITAYLLFGVLACLLPDKPIHRHIEQTVERGELHWNDYPLAIINGGQTRMDNFTDALIISQAWNSSKDSLWESVMQPSRAVYNQSMTEALAMQVEGMHFCNKKYGRYWHGSTFLMRILLLIWSYNNIRMLFYMVSSLLIVIALWRMCEKIGTWAAAVTLVAFMLVYGFVLQFSIQFMPVLVLTFAGIIAMLNDKNDKLMACFVIGSLTAYFDLLTTPLLTLFIPLIAWILVQRDNNQTLGKSLTETIKMSVLWGIAFAITWASKWVLATLTTDTNIWADAIQNVAHRSGYIEDYTRLDAIMSNVDLLNSKFVIITVIVMTIIMALHFRREGWRQALLLLLIAIVPFVWYYVVANHSYEHFWFTYRLQFISLLALFAAIGSLTDWRELKGGVKGDNT